MAIRALMPEKLDINSASMEQLAALKGIGEIYAAMINRERPYQTTNELIKKKAIPAAIYDQIKTTSLLSRVLARWPYRNPSQKPYLLCAFTVRRIVPQGNGNGFFPALLVCGVPIWLGLCKHPRIPASLPMLASGYPRLGTTCASAHPSEAHSKGPADKLSRSQQANTNKIAASKNRPRGAHCAGSYRAYTPQCQKAGTRSCAAGPGSRTSNSASHNCRYARPIRRVRTGLDGASQERHPRRARVVLSHHACQVGIEAAAKPAAGG
jgi:hypothetical protein